MRLRDEKPLSPRQRECMEGRQKHLSAKEIGRLLNISPHTVAMRWRLARLKLRPSDDGRQNPTQSVRSSGNARDWVAPVAVATLLFCALAAVLTMLVWITLYFDLLRPYLRE